jgi:exopolysaccharide biosynthesis predicted pyruvyltransferase EpsI
MSINHTDNSSETKTILVLGFYNQANLGDEMFKETIPNLFAEYNCIFYDIDYYHENQLSDINIFSAIIYGGGDILNSYFLPKIQNIVKKYNGPIYALGVGISYEEDMLTSSNIFHHYFLRSKRDLKKLGNMIGDRYIHYLPDLGFVHKPRDLRIRKNDTKTVGVFLAQPMVNDVGYIEGVFKLIKDQIKNGSNVTLYAFNTSSNKDESDFIINDFVASRFKKVKVDKTVYTSSQMIDIMSNLDLAICSRFHAHIFAIVAGCPFISYSKTRKVELLLQDFSLTPESCLDPTRLNVIAQQNHKLLSTHQLNNMVSYRETRHIKYRLNDQEIYETVSKISDPDKKSEMLCYLTTDKVGSKYVWGTTQNIKSDQHNIKDMISWIRYDHSQYKPQGKLMSKLYNTEVFNHRSGWSYVTSNLLHLESDTGVIFDNFADRTFLWCKSVLESRGLLPYTSRWIGIFHHCLNEQYTENNTVSIVKSEAFQKSLPTCIGIICLSEYLSSWFRDQIKKLGYNVPILTLHHPIPLTGFDLWQPSDEYTLVNIGGWYRNLFTIYTIPKVEGFRKTLLKTDTHGFHLPINTSDNDLVKTVSYNEDKWLWSLQNYIHLGGKWTHDMVNSVEIISHLSNKNYDKLLSRSVVFLDLIDVSAANTIIECIVRNTPLVVNRVAATEEYLGKDYPLFYDNYDQIPTLLRKETILNAWTYLQRLDKTFLSIDTFTEKLMSSEIYKSI